MSSEKMTKIMIVDDHDVVRRGLSVFLRAFEDFELIGEAGNGIEAVELCGTLLPDVVLMDIVMPLMDGVMATQQIKKLYPQIRVMALTSLKDDQLVAQMLNAGAVNFILKDASIDELADAIRSAADASA